MTWKAYHKIIFPLGNILRKTREDEGRDTAAKKNLTYSIIWWQQTGTQRSTLHLKPRQHTANPSWHRQKHNQSAFHQCHCHYTGHLEPTAWLWIIWLYYEIQILPQHRTQTSDCPSCGDTWAWRRARWGGRRPDRGHLSWFLYPPCMRTPGNKISQSAHEKHQEADITHKHSRTVNHDCVWKSYLFGVLFGLTDIFFMICEPDSD